MTLEELLNDEVFSKAVYMYKCRDDIITSEEQVRMHGKQHVFDMLDTRLCFANCIKRNVTIYDYSSLTQIEIHNLTDAKIKYDFCLINYNKFSHVVTHIMSDNNDNIKKYDLSQMTPELLHEIIHKNEVFISNLNSLYSSNKILAELDAL